MEEEEDEQEEGGGVALTRSSDVLNGFHLLFREVNVFAAVRIVRLDLVILKGSERNGKTDAVTTTKGREGGERQCVRQRERERERVRDRERHRQRERERKRERERERERKREKERERERERERRLSARMHSPASVCERKQVRLLRYLQHSAGVVT